MRWNSRYAAGARLIAVPGWPLPAFSTASIASTRTVSTARRSTSDQESSGPLTSSTLTAVLLLSNGEVANFLVRVIRSTLPTNGSAHALSTMFRTSATLPAATVVDGLTEQRGLIAVPMGHLGFSP